MKILVLNHEFPPVGGGAAPVSYELCKQLVSMGHTVDVVTMHYADLPRHEEVDDFNVYRTRAIRKKPDICHTHEMATYLPGAIFKTLSLCKQNKYDIIHCHFLVPGAPLAWMVSKRTGIPFIVTCHGSDVPGYNPDRFSLVHKIIMPAWRFLARRSDMLVSPSRSLKDLIEKQCSGVDVKIVTNGIYTERFTPTKKVDRILMCSRLLPRKGFQYAIEALTGIADGWEIDVVGDGPFLGELKNVAQANSVNVNFHGWMDRDDEKFAELFRESSIFVFPSESENFPSVLLEAMSAGMAIVTSTAGGCPEVVGDAGLLAEPRNVEQIRESIVRLLEDTELREELAADALKRVEKFSWQNVAKQYVQCYETVLENRDKKNG